MEQQNQEQAQQTGTRNQTYDVIAVLYHALQGAENCQIYARDAHDDQVRGFFQKALDMQRQLAEQGKQVLEQALQFEASGPSAFGWQSKNQADVGSQTQSTSTDGQATESR